MFQALHAHHHVEEYNKHIVKLSKCASSWSLSKLILRCTVNRT